VVASQLTGKTRQITRQDVASDPINAVQFRVQFIIRIIEIYHCDNRESLTWIYRQDAHFEGNDFSGTCIVSSRTDKVRATYWTSTSVKDHVFNIY